MTDEETRAEVRRMIDAGASRPDLAAYCHERGLTVSAATSLIDEARRYAALGWPVVRTDGKKPADREWQRLATTDPGQIELAFRKPHSGIGVLLGQRSGLIDFDADDEAAEEQFQNLFDGQVPETPSFKSTRGMHRFFQYTPLLPQGIIRIKKLEIRIGSSERGFQTVIPPSGGRSWLVDPFVTKPAELPYAVIERILKSADPERPKGSAGHAAARSDANENRARAWIAKCDPAISGQGGHLKTFIVALALASFSLDRETMFRLMTEYNQRCLPPWSDSELWHKIDSAIEANPQPKPDRKRQSGKKRGDQQEDDEAEEKRELKDLDAMPEARDLLTRLATHMEGEDQLHKLRFWRGEWWWWNGSHYRAESDADVESKVVRYLDTEFCKLSGAAVRNVTMCLAAETNVNCHREMPTWFDGSTGSYLPCRNGIVDISAVLRGDQDNVLIPHTPRYFCNYALPYDFSPDADCPRWLAFLQRNLEGDVERISLLQEFFGYCLDSTLSAQKFLFFEGQGSNGKSVACAALIGMLGTQNISSVSLEQFGERFGLSSTLGKLANITTEMGEIDKVAEGILKSYTTGDPLQIDRKHRDPVTVRPTTKLVFASNNRPRFSDKTNGLWRRMILMPWLVQIPPNERVTGMDRPEWWEQQDELSGILLWSLAGLWRLQQNGGVFTRSSLCERELERYRHESNPTRIFLEEFYVESFDEHVECAWMYDHYREWVKSNGFHPVASNTFAAEVSRTFKSEKRQIMRDGKRYYAFLGITKH